jgi:hypothetical protein
MDWIQALGVVGGVLSILLALLKLREYVLQTPRFDVAAIQGENDDHLDIYVRVVKRRSAAAYLSVVGLSWQPGKVPFTFTPHSGAGLRELGEATALEKSAYRPRFLERRFKFLRRSMAMNAVAFGLAAGQLPRLMQIEGETAVTKRCARRLVGLVRMFGGPPTFVAAQDSLGRYSWAPIPSAIQQGILREAMDDTTNPGDESPCPDDGVGARLYAGSEERPILLDDRPTAFYF